MYEHEISNIEAVLNTDRLTECSHVTAFAGDLPTPSTSLEIDGIHVDLHCRDDSAVVIVDYPAGACASDTAFSGDLKDAHKAVVRIAHHTDATVIRDEFDVLSVDTAGEER